MGFKDAQGFKVPRTARTTADPGLPASPQNPPAPAPDAPHYHGHRERLRDRFMDGGPDALPDYEMLELILFRAIPRQDTKPVALALRARCGSFGDVLAAAPDRL